MKKLLIVFCLLATSSFSYGRDWSSYSSENLRIYSDASPNKIEKILRKFEVYRYITMNMLNLTNAPDNQKLTIFMFNKSRDFNKVRPGDVAGFYFNSNAGPRMVVGPYRNNSQMILFHEYVHYLVSENSNVNYPRWYNEGLADVLASVDFLRNEIRIGMLPDGRSMWLNWERKLEVSDLIRIEPRQSSLNSENYEGRFYAMAWVFVHYLQLGALVGDQELLVQTKNFLDRFDQGEEPETAFVASFGMSTDEMDTILNAYIRNNEYAVLTLPNMEYSGDIVVEAIPDNTINYLLAALANQLGNDELAFQYLEDIGEESDISEALALRAIMHNHNDNVELANQDASKALLMGEDNSDVLSSLAHYEWDNYNRLSEAGNTDQTVLDQALILANKAIEQDGNNIQAYYFKTLILGRMGNNNDAIRSIIQAYKLFPSNSSFSLILAKLLIIEKRLEEARPFVKKTISAIHSNESRALIQTILNQIDSGEVDITLFDNLL